MTERDIMDRLTAANSRVSISRRGGLIQIGGMAQSWAYAASAPLDASGVATVNARVKLLSGTMSVGILAKDRSAFVIERAIPRTDEFIDVSIPLTEAGACSDVIFRTFDKAHEVPVLEVESLILRRQLDSDGPTLPAPDHPIDPIVENLWPLEVPIFNINDMRRWSRTDLLKHFTGDAWRDNLILNKYEFAHGEFSLGKLSVALFCAVRSMQCALRILFCLASARAADAGRLVGSARHCSPLLSTNRYGRVGRAAHSSAVR